MANCRGSYDREGKVTSNMASTFMTDGNDFALSVNGRLVLETDPVVAAAIKLKHRFQFFKGEWFLDTRQGIPYFTTILGVKKPNIEIIRRMIRRIILSCPPITAIPRLDVYYLPSARKLTFEFEATADDGRTVSGGSGKPFIVGVDGEEIQV